MLYAAAISQLDNCPLVTAGAGPSNHASMPHAAATHGHREDIRPTADKDSLAMAWQASAAPSAFATDPLLELVLEAGSITCVGDEVDVELVDGAVTRRVHDQGTVAAAATRVSCVHAVVVVADIATVDVFDASATAPNLVSTLGPTSSHFDRGEVLGTKQVALRIDGVTVLVLLLLCRNAGRVHLVLLLRTVAREGRAVLLERVQGTRPLRARIQRHGFRELRCLVGRCGPGQDRSTKHEESDDHGYDGYGGYAW
mmetsp:Transcript_107740/g.150245  ORF Transcript_107740/g.150245 Transcript_107740/m.150245 type:complete len:255 (+) Transcript_107740:284-1048(+)